MKIVIIAVLHPATDESARITTMITVTIAVLHPATDAVLHPAAAGAGTPAPRPPAGRARVRALEQLPRHVGRDGRRPAAVHQLRPPLLRRQRVEPPARCVGDTEAIAI